MIALYDCPACGGSGEREALCSDGYYSARCDHCDGEGYVESDEDACPVDTDPHPADCEPPLEAADEAFEAMAWSQAHEHARRTAFGTWR